MGKNKCYYIESLKRLNIQSLKERRKHLCLTFDRQTLQNRKTRKMFPMRKEIRDGLKSFKFKNQTLKD